MFRRLFLAVPAVIIMGLLGGLVGMIWDSFFLGFAIGALIPLAWLAVVFLMLAVGLGLAQRLIDSTRPPR